MSKKRDITLGGRFKKQVVEVEIRNNRRPPYPANPTKEPSKEEEERKKLALDNFALSSTSAPDVAEKKLDQNTKKRALFFGDKKLVRSINQAHKAKYPPSPHHHPRTDSPHATPYRPHTAPRPGQFPYQKKPPYPPRQIQGVYFKAPGDRPAVPYSRPPMSQGYSQGYKKPMFPPRPGGTMTRPGGTSSTPRPFDKPFFSRPFSSSFTPTKKPLGAIKPDTQKRQQVRKVESRFERNPRSRSPFQTGNNIQLGHRFIGRIESADDVSINLERQRSISAMKRSREKQKRVNQVVRDVTIFKNVSVGSLSSSMAVSVGEVIEKLREMEVSAQKDTKLDIDIANIIVQQFGHNVKMKIEPLDSIKIDEGLEEEQELRAPIVTVVGHVDHGKTSLLDALRMTQFTAKESGGITQSIGASQVFTKDKRFITFIDTPGHEIFTEMRARGVNITDIVLIIISADDGIKDQTIESIQHAKASKAFMIVVITKIDKPGVNTEKIKQMLFQYNIAVESMGGDVPDIEVSSKTGQNMSELVELILICSETLNLRASPKPLAHGVVLESHLDKNIGPVATIIIKSGTLKNQHSFLSGNTYGKVKAIRDWTGKILKSAGPSYPVQIMGFDETPSPGQDFIVMDELEARELSVKRKDSVSSLIMEDKTTQLYSVQDIWAALVGKEEINQMNFIIKADTSGSVEAIASSIGKLKMNSTSFEIILKGVGGVNESDVMLAKTSNAVIIAFKVDVSSQITRVAQSFTIDVKRYSVIYKIMEDIEDEITQRLRPKEEEVSIGRAVIRELFSKPKLPTIAGCFVTDGVIRKEEKCIILRNGIQIYESKIISLKHQKDDRRELKSNQECGLIVENFVDYKIGDVIECFEKKALP